MANNVFTICRIGTSNSFLVGTDIGICRVDIIQDKQLRLTLLQVYSREDSFTTMPILSILEIPGC